MSILIFHKTKDSDLEKGLLVARQDTSGQYTLTGPIENIFMADGVRLYVTGSAAYTADELKLIVPEIASTYRELEIMVLQHKNFVPVTEDLFFNALEVLPPRYLSNGCFQVDECHSEDLYHTFGEKDGKYYGCLCNKNFALNNF